MTPDRPDHTPEASENGVLSDTGSIETAGFGILGGTTAQVNVELPTESDDDFVDDDVIGDEVPFVVEIPADTTEAEIVDNAAAYEDWAFEDDGVATADTADIVAAVEVDEDLATV
ncbi:MAG: MinD/ParA family protein, partial [Microbacterium sp.]